MNNENNDILLIDERFGLTFMEEECESIKLIMKAFMECYVENKDMPIEVWLSEMIHEQLPDRKLEEIQVMTEEIITTIKMNEANKESLAKAIENGRNKENWFASEIQKATSSMSTQDTVKYLGGLDTALKTANYWLHDTITTNDNLINQNPRLDGFIAEQYHTQTFNLNASARGSEYRAKVLKPNGKSYAKNSVDIVIVDHNGKVVRRYQSKYCKDAKSTEQAFANGNYRGQQKLVPEGQQAEIQKKSTIVIEAPDGTTSNPLSKSTAEQMRDEAQNGNWNDLNWNEYKTKDLAIGIGKQVGYAALQGAAMGVGFDVAQRVWNGEELEGEEIIETALETGADFGIKAAVSGAVKVGVEKDIIKIIPKGTPTGTIANIAFIAVEDAKVLGKIVTGELLIKEGIEKIEQTTVATAAGLVTMGKGATIGKAVGAVLGPVGVAVGGFIGGTIGYMSGSTAGKNVVRGTQKICDEVSKIAKIIASDVKETVTTVVSGVENFCSDLLSFFAF